MTNAQKQMLRNIIRNEPERTNKDIADDVECHIATVRNYRKAIAPEIKGPWKIGDKVPIEPHKLDVRPTFTGAGKPSFKPARKK